MYLCSRWEKEWERETEEFLRGGCHLPLFLHIFYLLFCFCCISINLLRCICVRTEIEGLESFWETPLSFPSHFYLLFFFCCISLDLLKCICEIKKYICVRAERERETGEYLRGRRSPPHSLLTQSKYKTVLYFCISILILFGFVFEVRYVFSYVLSKEEDVANFFSFRIFVHFLFVLVFWILAYLYTFKI